MMKKVFLFTVCLPFANVADAELAMFSRASCGGFNESISWDPFTNWTLSTISSQENAETGEYREFEASNDLTRRSYAGCAFCGSGWEVMGFHMVGENPEEMWQADFFQDFCDSGFWGGTAQSHNLCKETYATDCNLTEW